MNMLLEWRNDPLVARLGWTLLHFLWQGAVCGAVAAIALRVLATRSAVTRYRAALALFLVMAAAPVAAFAWLQVDGTTTRITDNESVTRIAPIPHIPVPTDSRADERLNNAATMPVPTPIAIQPATDSHNASSESTTGFAIPGISSIVLPWVVGGWLIGVVLLSLRLCGGWLWTRRLLTVRTQPLGESWNSTIDRLCRQLKVARAVRFVESGIARAPLVIGWLRPVVVLPASILSGLAPHEIECLLAHELAHIRRHDYLVNLGQCVVEVLLFYHPAVWWLSWRVRQERECVCDELAAGVTGDRLAYSRALLSAAEVAARPPRIAVAGTQGDLSHRVHALLGLSRTSGRASGWIVIGLAALALVAVACFNLHRDEDASNNESSPAIETLLEGDVTLDPVSGVVVDEDGRPLSDVLVTLREGPQLRDGATGVPSETRDIARTTTNEQGRFEFHDVPYSSVFRDDGYPLDVVAVAPGKSIGWSHLGAWSPAEDSTSVRIVLQAEASVTGRILDDNGDPLPDATVRPKFLMSIRHVAQADLEKGRWPRLDDRRFVDTAWLDDAPSARTDEDGRFTLSQLPADSGVILGVAHPNYQLADAFTATVPELDAENAANMKRPVQTGDVQVQLKRGYVIHVQVVEDKTGNPVPGARYPDYLHDVVHPPRLVADEEGRFDMQHLESPVADLYVYPPDGSSLLGAYVRISLPTDEFEHDVTVPLPQGAVVSGWVLNSETEQGIEGVQLFVSSSPEPPPVPRGGSPIMETEQGAEGAQAVARSQITPNGPAATAPIIVSPQVMRPVVTDSTGAFQAAVPPGQVEFRLYNVSGYRAPRLDSGQSILDSPAQAYAIVEIGNPVTDLLLELEPTPSVAGTVTDPDGVPLPGVEITATIHRPSTYGTSARTINEVTDADGHYQIDSLFDDADSGPANRREVIFHNPERNLGASILLDPPNPGDPRVRPRDVQLLPLAAVTGRFVNYDTGQPVPGVRIMLYKRHFGTTMAEAIGTLATSGRDGRFRLEGAFPEREHHLSITASGFQYFNGLDTTFAAESGQTHDFGDLVLVPDMPPDVAELAPIQAPDVSGLTPDEALARLESQYEEDYAAYRRQFDEADKRQRSWIVSRREPTPAYAAAMLDLARRHHDTDTEVRALVWLVDARRISGTEKRVAPLRREAAALLLENYIDRPELADCVTSLMYSESDITATGWRLVNENPHDAVRGRALFDLAEYEMNMLDPRYGVRQGSRDEAISLLERVVEQFGDVPHWRYGTLGKAAELHLFKLEHLVAGGTAPEITGTDLAGEEMKLSDFRGKVVVLNFWGSWCGPCISKIPALNRLSEEFGDDVAILGVASDTPADAAAAAAEHGIAYRSWVDGERGPIAEQWNVDSWPTTYVIDDAGVIRHVDPGADQLRQLVWELLQEG